VEKCSRHFSAMSINDPHWCVAFRLDGSPSAAEYAHFVPSDRRHPGVAAKAVFSDLAQGIDTCQ
jgi:hypothetical protein